MDSLKQLIGSAYWKTTHRSCDYNAIDHKSDLIAAMLKGNDLAQLEALDHIMAAEAEEPPGAVAAQEAKNQKGQETISKRLSRIGSKKF